MGNDVQDLLGIKADREAPSSTHNNHPKQKPKKPYIPRELQGLLGAEGWEDAVTLAPTNKPVYKSKLKKCSKWENVPIKSSARAGLTSGNDLNVNHWVKYFDMPDYRFARYNKQIKMITYTDEEYEKCLQNPAWTKDQTDRLMYLCKHFDLRFVIIHDRFTHPPICDKEAHKVLDDEERRELHLTDIVMTKNKTVEDLKSRFYSIQQALMKARNSSDLELEKQPIFDVKYDGEYESNRKDQLNKLFRRSKTQVGSMAALVMENRRLGQQLQRLKKSEKSNKGRGKGTSGGIKSEGGARYGAKDAISPVTSVKNEWEENKNSLLLVPVPMPAHCVVESVVKSRGTGCFLRSQQLTSPITLQGRQSIKQMENELSSLGFKKTVPFTVPAGEVCDLFDKLRADIATYINLQRHVQQREAVKDALKMGPITSKGQKGTKRKYEEGTGGAKEQGVAKKTRHRTSQ